MVTKIKQIILTALLLCASPAFATDLYWVGGSGNTNDGLVAHWATSSGATYVELATQPTAYDNCIFDANSNNASYTVTINQELTCKNFIWDNPSSGTTTLQSISRTLNVYGDFQLPSGMNWLHSSIVNLVSTSTNNTIKTNGVIMKSNLLQFNIGSATGVWSLLDDFNTTYDNGTTGFKGYALRVLTGGTFNTNLVFLRQLQQPGILVLVQ
jgi:hypothetical protein